MTCGTACPILSCSWITFLLMFSDEEETDRHWRCLRSTIHLESDRLIGMTFRSSFNIHPPSDEIRMSYPKSTIGLIDTRSSIKLRSGNTIARKESLSWAVAELQEVSPLA